MQSTFPYTFLLPPLLLLQTKVQNTRLRASSLLCTYLVNPQSLRPAIVCTLALQTNFEKPNKTETDNLYSKTDLQTDIMADIKMIHCSNELEMLDNRSPRKAFGSRDPARRTLR